jgi:hypothetical protein
MEMSLLPKILEKEERPAKNRPKNVIREVLKQNFFNKIFFKSPKSPRATPGAGLAASSTSSSKEPADAPDGEAADKGSKIHSDTGSPTIFFDFFLVSFSC